MTYTYDGNAHSPTVTYDSTYCNISGNGALTNAGSQVVTVSLKNTTNTQWSDGTIANKTATFVINKADLPYNITRFEMISGSSLIDYKNLYDGNIYRDLYIQPITLRLAFSQNDLSLISAPAYVNFTKSRNVNYDIQGYAAAINKSTPGVVFIGLAVSSSGSNIININGPASGSLKSRFGYLQNNDQSEYKITSVTLSSANDNYNPLTINLSSYNKTVMIYRQ